MKKTLIILGAVIAVIALGVISTLNGVVGLDEKCKADWSQVLNEYQRRYDATQELVATVKGSSAHEQDTLIQVVSARAKATQMTISPEMLSDEKAMNTFIQNQAALSSALSRLLVVAEQYPDLKANANFSMLQHQFEGMENRIAVARRDYIETVRVFNTKLRTIPTKWVVAAFSDLTPKATFSIDESMQEGPVVDFNK